MFNTISYPLCGLPMEPIRFFAVVISCVAMAFTAQALGNVASSMCDLKVRHMRFNCHDTMGGS